MGVRVVGVIRSGGRGRASAMEMFQVQAQPHSVLSFSPLSSGVPRKEIFPLDCCYLHPDAPDLFRLELLPLLRHSLFHGSNSCFLSFGSRPASQSPLLPGSTDKPGLVAMAMSEILHGFAGAVSISSYEVRHDQRVFDLLQPKEQDVLVLEDAHRRTHLKGLSKVNVSSIHEFSNLYSRDAPVRGHRGFIVYVSKLDQQGKECPFAKMHFLDLSGYQDVKHNPTARPALANGANGNKSLYALMNVIHAINANESFVPYRESKLTRILQDSLCKTSQSVLIACLDDVCCLDTISTLGLASRASQVVNEQRYSLSMRAKNSSRSTTSCATKVIRTPVSNKRPQPTAHSLKKPITSVSTSIKMKQKDAKSTMNARKLFGRSTNPVKNDALDAASTIVVQIEEAPSSLGEEIEAQLTNEGSDLAENAADAISCSMLEEVHCTMQEMDYPTSDFCAGDSSTNVGEVCSTNMADNLVEMTPASSAQPSSKLSDQLKEISNSLKLLSTRPVRVTTQKTDGACTRQICSDPTEPKTPEVHLKFDHDEDQHDIFKARSTGIKKYLVQECLTFLNSANKEQLKSLKGIGEKRANYIVQLREESPEPFKELNDLRYIIGLNSKEIKNMMSGMIDNA